LKNNILRAHLALLGANIIYGANYLIAKGVMPNKIGPSAFVFLRIFGAGLSNLLSKKRLIQKIFQG
jgi:drug/metabolite transporter (DMT)-like permease